MPSPLLALLLSAGAAADAAPLDWLAGRWCTEGAGADARTCESWSPMTGGTMLGTSQTVKDSRTQGYEFMRIVMESGKAVFHGSPDGSPPVAFAESAREGQSVAFLNAAHDYPQRITYRLSGERLDAEISLADGSKAARWHYRRMTKD